MNNLTIDWQLIDQVRQAKPIVLTLANTVTSAKVADGLSAIGASPIMSVDENEASEMVAIANAIVINLGTINQPQIAQIKAVLSCANGKKPLILDPVAINAIPSRKSLANDLLHRYHFDVIRGNASEIAALVGMDNTGHGIDAGFLPNSTEIAIQCANKFHSTVVLTGKTDVITDGTHHYSNNLSTPMLTVNVGSGDMLTSIIAAFIAVGHSNYQAAQVATLMFTVAGLTASQHANGLGTWQMNFFDQLSGMNSQKVQQFWESEVKSND